MPSSFGHAPHIMKSDVAKGVYKISINDNFRRRDSTPDLNPFHMGLWYHKGMFDRLAAYVRFVKMEHTLFSLPLLFSGAVLATGHLPSLKLSGLIIAAGFGARTAAFAFNRIIDRHIDRLNPRTANRELPGWQRNDFASSKPGASDASGIGIYEWAAWAIAPICFYLSPVPLIAFLLYPYLKRITPLAHFGVGAGGRFGSFGRMDGRAEIVYECWSGSLAGALLRSSG